MGGTTAGGKQAFHTNTKRHGADYYSKIGAIGGSRGKADGAIKGFARDKKLASIAGRKGGSISRRDYRKELERRFGS